VGVVALLDGFNQFLAPSATSSPCIQQGAAIIADIRGKPCGRQGNGAGKQVERQNMASAQSGTPRRPGRTFCWAEDQLATSRIRSEKYRPSTRKGETEQYERLAHGPAGGARNTWVISGIPAGQKEAHDQACRGTGRS